MVGFGLFYIVVLPREGDGFDDGAARGNGEMVDTHTSVNGGHKFFG